MKEVSTGGSASYYSVYIKDVEVPYVAECIDLLESLDLTYSEENIIKSIWRSAAARCLGIHKKGKTAVYDAEKVVFFINRICSSKGLGKEYYVNLTRKARKLPIKTYIYAPQNKGQKPYSLIFKELAQALNFTDEEAHIVETIWGCAETREGAYQNYHVTYDRIEKQELRSCAANILEDTIGGR